MRAALRSIPRRTLLAAFAALLGVPGVLSCRTPPDEPPRVGVLEGFPRVGETLALIDTAVERVATFRGLGSAHALTWSNRLAFVFVSDAGAEPWTQERRATVERHVESALRWHEREAGRYGNNLTWKHVCLPRDAVSVSIEDRIDEKDGTAGPHHSTWQNTVAARLAGKSGSVASLWNEIFAPFGPIDAEKTGTAVLFCVRRYYPSVSFPFAPGHHPEFLKERGIIYDKGGPNEGQRYLDSLIAHELLHLYGAIDLDPPKIPEHARPAHDSINAHTAGNDVMKVPTQMPIASYEVGELTAWLVGWRDRPPSWLERDR